MSGLFFTADLSEVGRKKLLILLFLTPSKPNEIKYSHIVFLEKTLKLAKNRKAKKK